MNIKHRELIKVAKNARQHAFCPYSDYDVGAAVLAGSGRIYAGVNVESPTLIANICAERNAIFSMITHGERKILAVATACRDSEPCGTCRQLILEFADGDIPIYSVHSDPSRGPERVVRTSIYRLMPRAHTGKKIGFVTEQKFRKRG